MASGAVPVMPGGHRVLGHALEFGRDPLALFQRAREHGEVVRMRFGPFGFAWTEATLLLSAIAARWQLRLADGADVHPVISSTLVPSELPIIVTRRSPARGAGR